MIALATSALRDLGTSRVPARVTIDTSFSCASKPIPGLDTSLRTIASTPLRSSFPRARSAAPSPCSAAKPTIVWLDQLQLEITPTGACTQWEYGQGQPLVSVRSDNESVSRILRTNVNYVAVEVT